MEVVKTGSSDDVLWLKCPGCDGFLPHLGDDTGELDDTGEIDGSQIALEDLDVENAKEYVDSQVYDVGDVIHHRSWNDYGKIMSKGTLPGNRKTIWVQFLRQGKVQLLEGVTS